MTASPSTQTLEKIYDTHGPLVYGIALEIAPTEQEANDILLGTFQKLHRQDLIQGNQHCMDATLIQLTIQTAYELLKQKATILLQRFADLPILRQLLCEQTSLTYYCEKNGLTRSAAIQALSAEFWHLITLNQSQLPVQQTAAQRE